MDQVKASNRYTLEHFDQDLRTVMWRVGVQGEQVCFIFDESNVLSPAFLERLVTNDDTSYRCSRTYAM